MTPAPSGDRNNPLPYILGLIGAVLVLLGLFALPFFGGVDGVDGSLGAIFLDRDDLLSLCLSYLLAPVLFIAVSVIGLTSRVRLPWVGGVLIGAGAVTAGIHLDYILGGHAREGPWLVLVGSGAALSGGLVAILRPGRERSSG
jgi:hypothetical protein